MQVPLVQPVAVGGCLCPLHDIAQVIGRQLTALPALEDFLLEQIPRVDVDDHLSVADQRCLEDVELLFRIGGFGQDRLHHHGFAHDRRSLCQDHRRVALQRRLSGRVVAFIVESVAQLVRKGGHLVQRTIEVAQHARFTRGPNPHAERAAPLPLTLLGIDPGAVEGPPRQVLQMWREVAKVLQDETACLTEGVGLLRLAGRGPQIPPGQPLLAQALRLPAPVLAKDRKRIGHCAKHRIQGLPVDARVVHRPMKGIAPAPAPVQGVGRAFNAVHASGQGLADRGEERDLRFIRAAAHIFRRVRMQIDQCGKRQLPDLAAKLEVRCQL